MIIRTLSRVSEKPSEDNSTSLGIASFAALYLGQIGPMKPQPTPLSQAVRRNPRLPRRPPIAARTFTTAQTNLLRCENCRPTLAYKTALASRQTRRITQQWLRRMKEGEQEWAGHAEQIKAGKRKSFAAHLEERGLIHDVVGYVGRLEAAGS